MVLQVYTGLMMADNSPFTTWLEIDLNAIKNNIHYFKQLTSGAVMSVVKANAYGHGAIPVARASADAGAEWLSVARIEEALALRQANIPTPLLVMGYTRPDVVYEAIYHNLSLTLFDKPTAQLYLEQARSAGQKLKVHVKVDTGMGRLGLFPEESLKLMTWLSQQEWIVVEGLFTHFARPDEPAIATTSQQIEKFKWLVKTLESLGLRPKWVHAGNSAAIFNFPDAYFDMVRPGISLYGLSPSSKTPVPPAVQPALTWKTRLVSVKDMPPGQGISYSHIYTTTQQERIGVMAVGYADNFRRQNGNIALVNGKRVKVVGRVCMDQCMLQLDTTPNAQVGDEVVLIGHQGEEQITADEVASIWNTVNYEVVANLADRLPRIYV